MVYRGLERSCELVYRSSIGDEGRIPLTCLFVFVTSATEFSGSLEADFEGLFEKDFEECLEEDLCERLEDRFDSDFEVFEFLFLDLDWPDRLVGEEREALFT
jgi:hypothetical protein